ncbi:hypothetical protein ACNS7O_07165 [Haloferacaceae archaeon DSL9]
MTDDEAPNGRSDVSDDLGSLTRRRSGHAAAAASRTGAGDDEEERLTNG